MMVMRAASNQDLQGSKALSGRRRRAVVLLSTLACSGTLSCELLVADIPRTGPDAAPPPSSQHAGEWSALENHGDPSATEIMQSADAPAQAQPVGTLDGLSDAGASAAQAKVDATMGGASDDSLTDTRPDAASNAEVNGWSYVQVAVATPPGFVQLSSVTFPEAQLAGDLVVVAVGWGDTTDNVAQVSDTRGNGYLLAIGPTRTAGLSQAIYYAKNIANAVAGTNMLNVRFGLPVPRVDLRAVEYSGFDPVAPLDAIAAQSGAGKVATSGNVEAHGAFELVFGAGIATDTFSGAGPPFALRTVTANGNVVEDCAVSSAGTYSAGASLPNSVDWVMQAVTFRRR
jgi:hypothetical protein